MHYVADPDVRFARTYHSTGSGKTPRAVRRDSPQRRIGHCPKDRTWKNGRVKPPGRPVARPAPPAWLRDCPPREELASDGPPASWSPHSCRLATSGTCPLESRLWQSQKPWPSYTSIFSAVADRLRNTNTQPLNGSCFSTSLHNRAKPSIPRRKSAGSTAATIRI